MFVTVPNYTATTYIAIAHIVEIKPIGDQQCIVITTTGETQCSISANALIATIISTAHREEHPHGRPDIYLQDIVKT
jgi:hypothetical protein